MNDTKNNAPKSNADFYRETVFLPKTDFPMRGNLPRKEPEMVKKWQDMDLYKTLRETSKDRERWILHDGPPYANGHIHMGHALNKILKDAINKSWQMLGYDAPYVPGWDCHGLPIEWKIEEQHREKNANSENSEEIDPLAFREECRQFAQKWVNTQSEDFQRLGVTGDFKNPYLTMTKHAEARIVGEIHKFLLNGSLYRGVKPVMWSTVEKTALAEAEVEYKDYKSITTWVRFPVEHPGCSELDGVDIVIWTTTAWTLPSNRAIAFGKDIEYAVFEVTETQEDSTAKAGDRLAVATSLAEDVKEKAKIKDWKLITYVKDDMLSRTVCKHPLNGKGYDYDVPLLEADFVTTDTGTGFVHIAPSHGADDFYLGMANNLEIPDNVTDDGRFKEDLPLFGGEPFYDENGKIAAGNFSVIREINNVGKLLAKGSLHHDYPHSWRSKAPVIFRTTPQWFIAMDDNNKLRKKALKAIEQTKWVPEKGRARITAMVEQRPDWCISRQRAWGVPIALFVNKKTGKPLKDESVLKRIADIFEEEGSDAWWSRKAEDFLGNDYNPEDYEQIFDIVDVWFESGSTHTFVVDDREELAKEQSDLYLEGSDQHRGWFQSSLLEACGTKGQAPFKTVLTHGFVLDEKGYKMSKSLGNVVDPLKVIDQYGADILRLWTMTADYSQDIRIGKDTLKLTSDLYRRIRNTLRFLLGSLDGFTEQEKLNASEYKNMPELEQLMLHELFTMDKEVRTHIENYDYGRLAHKLHSFCNNTLSAFYFDIRKDRLYCDRPDSFERRACRTVLFHIFDSLVTWLAPILSFTTEEAWSHRPRGIFTEDIKSIHLRTFPEIPQDWENRELAQKWEQVKKIRNVVLGAIEPYRKDKTIGSSLQAAPQIYVNDEYAKAIEGLDMAEICITSQAEVINQEPPQDAFTLENTAGIGVVFQLAKGKKCERCWKILPEVGTDPEYPDLTLRDADAVRWYLKNKKAA